jgi:hypothetical protein
VTRTLRHGPNAIAARIRKGLSGFCVEYGFSFEFKSLESKVTDKQSASHRYRNKCGDDLSAVLP